jgi:hypothetical protein
MITPQSRSFPKASHRWALIRRRKEAMKNLQRGSSLDLFLPIIKQFCTILFILAAIFLVVKLNLLRDILKVVKVTWTPPNGGTLEIGPQEEAKKEFAVGIGGFQLELARKDVTKAIQVFEAKDAQKPQ